MHLRREEESWRGASVGQAAWRRMEGSHVANVYTHTHALLNSQSGLLTGKRASFPAARDLRDPGLAFGVFGQAHRNLHALATAATAAMTTKSTTAAATDRRPPYRVARCEREDNEGHSTNTVCALPRPLSIRSRNLRCPPTHSSPQGTRSTHLRARPTLRPARNAHRPLGPQSPRLSSCTVVHRKTHGERTSNGAAERSDVKEKIHTFRVTEKNEINNFPTIFVEGVVVAHRRFKKMIFFIII